jgi:glyoxylate reductase
MARKRPLVVVTRKLPDVVETRMMELFDTRLNDSDTPMTKAELVEAVKTCEVLVPTASPRRSCPHAAARSAAIPSVFAWRCL